MADFLDGVEQGGSGGSGGAGVFLSSDSVTDATLVTVLKNIPSDDSIPQRTEMGDIISLAFTPVSATSTLYISVLFGSISPASPATAVCSVFKDGTADAIGSADKTIGSGGWSETLPLIVKVPSSTTDARTYVVGLGILGASVTLTVNGVTGARKLGGTFVTTMSITEREE